MKVPLPLRSKSLKKSRGHPSCSLSLLLLIAGVQFLVIGMYPQILSGNALFCQRNGYEHMMFDSWVNSSVACQCPSILVM
jgi:hypothetical protein